MTRVEWLADKHRRIDTTISTLETQTPALWCESHRRLLQDLKKQRLELKLEIESLNKDATNPA